MTTDESGVYIVIFYLLYDFSIPSRIHKCLSIFHEHYFRYIIYVHKYDLWDHSNVLYFRSQTSFILHHQNLLTRLIRQDQRIRKLERGPISKKNFDGCCYLNSSWTFSSFSMNASKKVRFFCVSCKYKEIVWVKFQHKIWQNI